MTSVFKFKIDDCSFGMLILSVVIIHCDITFLLLKTNLRFSCRAVAKYLQTLFDKEAVNGKRVVGMDSLLNGKTRKEASRMFFETLVSLIIIIVMFRFSFILVISYAFVRGSMRM